MVGVGDLAENETLFFASGLYVNIAEVEHCGDESFDGGSDILDTSKVELAYLARKQAFLFDVDNAFIGNDPDIEVVIDPRKETKEPHKHEKGVFNKDKKARVLYANYFWEKDGEKEHTCDEQT